MGEAFGVGNEKRPRVPRGDDNGEVKGMGNHQFRILLPCLSPTGEEKTHTVLIDDDGFVTAPDHDAEQWSQTVNIMHALGGDADTSACAWWKSLNEPTPDYWANSEWQDGRLLVTLGQTGIHFDVESYDVSEWTIPPQQTWTRPIRLAVERGLGLHLPVTEEQWQDWETYNDVTPEDILTFLQTQGTSHTAEGNIPAVALLRTIHMLHDRPVGNQLHDWQATGQPWTTWEGWDRQGYSAADTEEFCSAYAQAAATLSARFPKEVRESMVFHSPLSLAEALNSAGVERDRAIPLLRYAPQIIFPDWPGLAESEMTDIPPGVPRTWVAEALMCIPSAGFLKGMDRTQWSRDVAATIPRRLAEQGDPLGWDPQWCWPAGLYPSDAAQESDAPCQP